MRKEALSLAASLTLLLASVLTGQEQAARPTIPGRVPVTLVLVEHARPDTPFVIQRRPDLTPHDVIVLRSDATADQLSDAVRSLLAIRQASGDTATARAAVRTRPASATAPGARRRIPWTERVLADLRRAEAREIAGFGRVRAVEIWLPPQRRRAPAR